MTPEERGNEIVARWQFGALKLDLAQEIADAIREAHKEQREMDARIACGCPEYLCGLHSIRVVNIPENKVCCGPKIAAAIRAQDKEAKL